VALAALPANIAARGVSLGLGTQHAAMQVQAGRVTCHVRAPHCVQWWASTAHVLAASGGRATLAPLAAQQVPVHFATYAVRRGWLALA
jgi:hypothetical protein